MGWAAARKLRRSVANLRAHPRRRAGVRRRGLELRAPLAPAAGTGAALAALRAPAWPAPDPTAGCRPTARRRAGPRRGIAAGGRRATVGPSRRCDGAGPIHLEARGGPAMTGPRPVRAPRGTGLSCRGWPQEAAFRMLQNNLDPEVAERPDDLVVYGGTGRAARSWDAFDAMCRTLTTLADDETMLVQSGKPVGVFRTHEWAPRVLIANSNLVPEWAHVGRVPPPRGPRPHHVRADDRRLVDLHRHPGDPAGHLRVLRRDRPPPLRRHAGRHDHPHRRARRHGRRPAAGRHHERRRGPVHRRRPPPASSAGSRPATSTRSPTRSTTPSPAAPGPATSAGRCRSAWCGNAAVRRAPAARPRLPRRHRHRPDQRPRPAQLRARRPHPRGHRRAGPHRPGRADPPGPGVDGRALPGDGRLPRPGRRGVRLRQQPADRGPARRLRPGLRLPRLPARLHPAAVLRGQGPVPVGGPVRRPGRHRRHRPGRARGVPRRRGPGPLDPPGRRAGGVPGPAGPHLLARLRRAPPARAALQRDGAHAASCRRRS